MLITFDGTAKSGKDSVASKVAVQLGFVHVNSGQLYRAVAAIHLETGKNRVLVAEMLNPADLKRADLETREVTKYTPKVANDPLVRNAVNRHLRWMMSSVRGAVMTGRAAAVEFPEAEAKFYITASLEERAARWQAQMSGAEKPPLEVIANHLFVRDEEDMNREVAPLMRVPTSLHYDFIIDSTDHNGVEDTNSRVMMALDSVQSASV